MKNHESSPASGLLRARFVVDTLLRSGHDEIAAPIGTIVCLYDQPEVIYPDVWSLTIARQLVNERELTPQARNYFELGYQAMQAAHVERITDAANETNEFLAAHPETVVLPPLPRYVLGGFVTHLAVEEANAQNHEATLAVYSSHQQLPVASFSRLMVDITTLNSDSQQILQTTWEEYK